MKCMNLKCKSTKRLRTVRTWDGPDVTRREKRCTKCGAQSFSLEMNEAAYKKEIADLGQQIDAREAAKQQAEYKTEEITDHIKALVGLVTVSVPSPGSRKSTRRR